MRGTSWGTNDCHAVMLSPDAIPESESKATITAGVATPATHAPQRANAASIIALWV